MGNDKFIELVSKHLTNDITPAESAELKHLITYFPAYKQQFDDLGMYWDHTDNEYTDDAIAFQKIQDKIKKLEDKGESEPEDSVIILPIAPSPKRIFRLWPAAAAAIVLVAAGLYLLNIFVFSANDSPEISTAGWQQKVTAKGAKSILTLSDGTRITLNSQSTLKYPANFSGDTREVTLSGEAYFDVKKDKEHPFIIHTDKMNVRVLGTTFNVRSYPRDTVSETTLINGAIEVTLKDRPADRIILKPNEKLIVKNDNAGDSKKLPDAVNAGGTPGAQYVLTTLNYIGGKDSSVSETSWIHNRFSFENDSFAVLAEKMERWYGVDIQFKNNKARQYNFSGVFENDTIEQALNALRDIEKFDYKISGSTIYIY
ncbi:FecR family protein [Mucilaginibacter sp. ZT4R22]|uniref:FecR family protein n=1 Tax=Mucilaginibacter pankratovii TaxID=2772110 RepID=A0ABR7WX03_9SPHI|nr:FecR family protein [Mucilaginibacter pankratovii]MBD1366808.1 FecR family protein [Mucilaginibacter pankratovii]